MAALRRPPRRAVPIAADDIEMRGDIGEHVPAPCACSPKYQKRHDASLCCVVTCFSIDDCCVAGRHAHGGVADPCGPAAEVALLDRGLE